MGERWTDIDLTTRRLVAAQRIAQWVKFSNQPARLRIACPRAGCGYAGGAAGGGSGGDRRAGGARGDGQPADLRLIDEAARSEWFRNASVARCAPGRGDKADKLVSDALASPDAATARPLLQAEHALGDENVFLPLGAPIRWSLIAGDLQDLH
jgi:hypothetical protein